MILSFKFSRLHKLELITIFLFVVSVLSVMHILVDYFS
jgi:hypothetical protein